jgi:DNA-directed RNA polymerase specialized sigma24 family protein
MPWLLVTCRNLAFNLNRKRRRDEAAQLTETLTMPATGVSDELVWVLDEIARLGDTDRELCRLCLIEGHDYGTAARQLGITPGGARKRIQRIRATLRTARAESEKEQS